MVSTEGSCRKRSKQGSHNTALAPSDGRPQTTQPQPCPDTWARLSSMIMLRIPSVVSHTQHAPKSGVSSSSGSTSATVTSSSSAAKRAKLSSSWLCGETAATSATTGIPLSVVPSQRRARTPSSISRTNGVLSIVIFTAAARPRSSQLLCLAGPETASARPSRGSAPCGRSRRQARPGPPFALGDGRPRSASAAVGPACRAPRRCRGSARCVAGRRPVTASPAPPARRPPRRAPRPPASARAALLLDLDQPTPAILPPKVTTPPAKAGGFSGKLGRNRLASLPKVVSRPDTERPPMHNLSRRNIARQHTSTVTAVCALSESLRLNRAAGRASLRRAARIDGDDRGTGSCSLVPKHRNQLRPRGVQYVLGEHAARQAAYVQLLNANARKSADKIRGEFVQEVGSAPRDPSGICGETRPSFAASLAATFAARQQSLPPSQPSRRLLRPLGPFDELAIRQGNDRGKAAVNANRFAATALGFLYLDVKDDKPLAALPCQNRGGWIARQSSVPFALDLAGDADNADALAFAQRQSIADAEFCSVVAGSSPEARKAWFVARFDAAEKGFECLVETPQHLLFGAITVAGQPLVSGPHRLQFVRLIGIAQTDIAAPVCLDPLLQSGVVEVTESVQHCGERKRLCPIWVETVFVCKAHSGNHSTGSHFVQFSVSQGRSCLQSHSVVEQGSGHRLWRAGGREPWQFRHLYVGFAARSLTAQCLPIAPVPGTIVSGVVNSEHVDESSCRCRAGACAVCPPPQSSAVGVRGSKALARTNNSTAEHDRSRLVRLFTAPATREPL